MSGVRLRPGDAWRTLHFSEEGHPSVSSHVYPTRGDALASLRHALNVWVGVRSVTETSQGFVVTGEAGGVSHHWPVLVSQTLADVVGDDVARTLVQGGWMPERRPMRDAVLISKDDFEVIYGALKMIVTGESYTTVQAVKLERTAWRIVSRVASRWRDSQGSV
ncbi:hypothetical protein BH24ACT15_BH24ACT15_32060 [soil metagenome]